MSKNLIIISNSRHAEFLISLSLYLELPFLCKHDNNQLIVPRLMDNEKKKTVIDRLHDSSISYSALGVQYTYIWVFEEIAEYLESYSTYGPDDTKTQFEFIDFFNLCATFDIIYDFLAQNDFFSPLMNETFNSLTATVFTSWFNDKPNRKVIKTYEDIKSLFLSFNL